MATKKIAEEAQAEEIVIEEVKDPWEEMVEMYVPRKRGDDPQYYVCVNDRRFAFPANGQVQKMPKPIAQILKESLEAEDAAEDFANSIQNEEPTQKL